MLVCAVQVPVPRVLCLCEDAAVLGAPFYVMAFVQGRIHLDPAVPGLLPAQVCSSPHHDLSEGPLACIIWDTVKCEIPA